MKVAVQGSKTFEDYQVFLRSMAVAMSSLSQGDELTIYTVGPHKVNNFVTGFANLSEDGLKARGMGVKYYRVSHTWLEERVDQMDYFVYLSNPDERPSRLVRSAESKGVEVGIFRY